MDPSWKIESHSSAEQEFLQKYNHDNGSHYTSVAEIVADKYSNSFLDPGNNGYYADASGQLPDEWFQDRVAEFLSQSGSGLTIADLNDNGLIQPVLSTRASLPTVPTSGYSSNYTLSYGYPNSAVTPDVLTQTWRLVVSGTWFASNRPNNYTATTTVPLTPIAFHNVFGAATSPLALVWDGPRAWLDYVASDGSLNTVAGGTPSWPQYTSFSQVSLTVGVLQPGDAANYAPRSQQTYSFGAGFDGVIGIEANQVNSQLVSAFQRTLNAQQFSRPASIVPTLLATAALRYNFQTDESQSAIDALFHTTPYRDAISIGVLSSSTTFSTRDPNSLVPYVPNQLSVDLRSENVSGVSLDNDALATDYRNALAGAVSSAEESGVWGDFSNLGFLSTVTLFQAARANGISFDIVHNVSEWNAVLPSLQSSLTSGDRAVLQQFVSDPNVVNVSFMTQHLSFPGWAGIGVAVLYNTGITKWGIVTEVNYTTSNITYGGTPSGSVTDLAPPSSEPYQAALDNRVNNANGAAIEDVTDISIPAPGLPLAFARHYDSTEAGDPTLGKGWYGSYSDFVTVNIDGSITWTDSDGNQLAFTAPAAGSSVYGNPPSVFGEMINVSATELSFTDKNGLTRKFYRTARWLDCCLRSAISMATS